MLSHQRGKNNHHSNNYSNSIFSSSLSFFVFILLANTKQLREVLSITVSNDREYSCLFLFTPLKDATINWNMKESVRVSYWMRPSLRVCIWMFLSRCTWLIFLHCDNRNAVSVTPHSDPSCLLVSIIIIFVSHNDVSGVRWELCDWLNWKNSEQNASFSDIPGHKFSNFCPFAAA